MSTCPRCGQEHPPDSAAFPACLSVAMSPASTEEGQHGPANGPAPYPVWFRRTFYGVLLGAAAVWFIAFTVLIKQAREQARRTQCYGNYKGISLALHNYHDTYGSLPAGWASDAAGRPLLSWRVAMLPFYDEQPLHEKFDKTQAWDGPANRPLLATRPRVFGCPSQDNYESEFTHKAGVTGPGTVFEGRVPVRFDEISDGLGNTIYAGEIVHRLEWSKPADIEGMKHLKLGDPQGFDGPHRDGVPFALMDGSHRFLSKDIDPEVLRRLFVRRDGLTLNERPDGTFETPVEESAPK